MDINISLDLPAIIAQAVSAERIQTIVDDAISKAIKSAIADATGYRSPFSEALKTQLSTALPHGLAADDVAKFQHILNTAMNKILQEQNSESVTAAIQKAVAAVMPDVPKVVKLSNLMTQAREGFHKESHEAFYAYYEPSEYGGGHLYLDGDESPGTRSIGTRHSDRESKKYSASFSLSFNKDGDVYALKFDDKDVTPMSRPIVVSRFEALIMAMYVGRTKLEVDMDDDDVRCEASEQYD